MYYYKLTVAYDGTDYCGWQVQPNGPTIQGLMMTAALELFGPSVTLTGASRTDAGVHANGQIVLLVGDRHIETYKLPLAMNMRLPKDIVVVLAEEVDETFHPRYCNLKKTYSYQVYNGPHQYPRDQRFSMHYRYPLELELMKKAAKIILGTHDFESYSSVGKKMESTVRTIYDLKITQEGHMIRFDIIGDGFLYNMVRIIIGTLLEVGNERRSLVSVEESFDKKSRKATGKTAHANGLTLEHIEYEI